MQCKSMNVKRRGLLAGACFAALLIAGAAGSAYAADYAPVTDARLANPEPGNWLMTRGNYKGWSYSPLDQINTSNVKSLVPVWSFSTGVDSGHEAPPIVNNGVMFVTTPYSQVHRARMRRPATCSGATSASCRKASAPCTTPTAAWRCTATRSTSRRSTPCWSRSTPRPARSPGRQRSRIGTAATT